MRRLIKAFRQGEDGNIPEDALKTRRERVAHRLGQRSLNHKLGLNQQINEKFTKQFEEAVDKSVGLNKQALLLMKKATDLPDKANAYPLWGGLVFHNGEGHVQEWNITINQSGTNPDSSAHAVNVDAPMGVLRIDSPDWSHNPFQVEVKSVILQISSEQNDDGSFEPARTTVFINHEPKESGSAVLDMAGTFTGEVKIEVAPDGTITTFGMSNSSQTGYRDEDPNRIECNLEEVLNSVNTSLEHTATIYQTLSDSLDNPL